MAESTKPSAGRKRSPSGNGRTTKASSSSASRPKSSTSRQTSRSSGRRASAKSSGDRRSTKPSASSSASRNGRAVTRSPGAKKQVTTTLGSAIRKARGPLLASGATAAAVAGGTLLKRQLAPKRRKVLGVPISTPHLDGLVPSGKLDVKSIAKGISEAGKRVTKASRQLSKLSDDVERVGKTAQKVGDSLS